MSELDDATTLKAPNTDETFYRLIDREAGMVIYCGTLAEEGMELVPLSETDLE